MAERSLIDRLEHRLARFLLGLPPRVQLRLCGGAPLERDALQLHPELQTLVALRALRRAPTLCEGSAAEARARFRREAIAHAGELVEVFAVRDLVIDGQGPLRLRHYAPEPSAVPSPLLLFLHGGGFVLGDLDTHDPVCRLLCRHAGVHVLSVDYRLAPEAPYPAALEDARAAFAWARANASELGADATRIAVGGDSAGGNLAAALSHRLRVDEVRPALQLLLYPAIDRSVVRPSLELFEEGFLLTRADIEWFQEQYLGAACDLDDPGHAPLKAPSLAGLPPALVVTAGFDPLRDEGEAYAAALREAGTPTVLRRFDQLVHGFANLVGISRASREAVVEIAGALRAMLATLDDTQVHVRQREPALFSGRPA